jgi:hypothetical protein
MFRLLASDGPRVARVTALACVMLLVAACASKPAVRLNHAEIAGVRIALPPSFGVLMKLYVDVYNPNSYDVAVRAVRGQVLLANRHVLPVDFRAQGEGVWLRSDVTTSIIVPVDVPIQVGLAVLEQSYSASMIPYHFTGRADVTATRTLRLETDDYSLSADGWVSRQQIEAALSGGS